MTAPDHAQLASIVARLTADGAPDHTLVCIMGDNGELERYLDGRLSLGDLRDITEGRT